MIELEGCGIAMFAQTEPDGGGSGGHAHPGGGGGQAEGEVLA